MTAATEYPQRIRHTPPTRGLSSGYELYKVAPMQYEARRPCHYYRHGHPITAANYARRAAWYTALMRPLPDGKYRCPVCGYAGLTEPPNNHNICECCSTHFAYDDATPTLEGTRARWAVLRAAWVAEGMRWWFNARAAPPGWDPAAQLERLTR